ncbi:MAG TPA: hypothetical protein VKJ65_04440 [Phycisphaerae bacterium]|nr:hypothetical protein [Phycisphaerae bacterium]
MLTNHYANIGKTAYGIYMSRDVLNGGRSQLWIGIEVGLLRLRNCAVRAAQAAETQTKSQMGFDTLQKHSLKIFHDIYIVEHMINFYNTRTLADLAGCIAKVLNS